MKSVKGLISSILKFMKELLKFPKTPVDFARLAVVLLVVFSVLSYLGVVALPVVVEGLQMKGKGSWREAGEKRELPEEEGAEKALLAMP